VCRIVNFTGTYEPNGYSYLAVYGWTTNPLIEFYVIENFHPDHEPAAPPEGEEKGNLTSDGSLYLIRTKMRVNKPSIQGTATFRQIFSVRQNKRSEGVVTVGNHFDAWKMVGLKTGTHNYMILAVEGMNSSGTAAMTVH
jgi:endo-1,4-beta-xylanase